MPFPCPDCSLMLPDNATYCPRCRPRVPCHRCGAPVYEKALICQHCRQWLGNRRRGPFWWQAYGTQLSVAALVYLGPLVGLVLIGMIGFALELWGRFDRLQQRADKVSLLLLAATAAFSVAAVYAIEKRARRKIKESAR